MTNTQWRKRDLWQYLSLYPAASYAELMDELGYLSRFTLKNDLYALERLGYIKGADARRYARRVLVPFGEGTVRVSERVAA